MVNVCSTLMIVLGGCVLLQNLGTLFDSSDVIPGFTLSVADLVQKLSF